MGARHTLDLTPLRRLPDGTVKQTNPYTGNEVWTVSGRGDRPIPAAITHPVPVDASRAGRYCAFCEDNYLRTPPELMRVVREGELWRTLSLSTAEELGASVAEFRVVPNLFPVLTYAYWQANYGYSPSHRELERASRYLSTPLGREHVDLIVRTRMLAAGHTTDETDAISDRTWQALALGFFASTHVVVTGRRHYLDGATMTDELAGSGSLRPEEHAQFLAVTVDAARAMFATNPHAANVAIFQNWLRPAGASFDHLHKQVVAVDELGAALRREVALARATPSVYTEYGVTYPASQGLIIAENPAGVVVAGYGHHYPSLEIFSRSASSRPWELTDSEFRGFCDLVHAAHAATGPDVATNEEWHYAPPSVEAPMPLRVVLKWRISTMAGFEGGTKIYLNTIDPWRLRDICVAALSDHRDRGLIAPGIAIGAECPGEPLGYWQR